MVRTRAAIPKTATCARRSGGDGTWRLLRRGNSSGGWRGGAESGHTVLGLCSMIRKQMILFEKLWVFASRSSGDCL
eukprot:4953479-Pleurochrysis_carterae.AAC.1